LGFFCGVGVSLSRGSMLFYPGVTVGIPHDTCCSPVGLLDVSQAVWNWHLVAQEPSCFFRVMWHGEAFYDLEVQDVKV
jgi:hypothetical protein